MRRLLLIFAAVALVAAVVGVVVLARENKGTGGNLADAVGDQLGYLDASSSLVAVIDLRYEEDNWEHVRALASRGLREYRALATPDELPGGAPNVTGALNVLANEAGLSFDKDVKPLLDGYLVVGVTIPPRGPLPLLPPLLQTTSEPRFVVTYRTHGEGLEGVVKKLMEGDRLRPLKGWEGVRLLDRQAALVGDDTLVFAEGGDESTPSAEPSGEVSPDLLQALDRATAGQGVPGSRLAAAQRLTGAKDPLVLAAGDLTLGRLLVEEPNRRRAMRKVPYLKAVKSLAAAVGIDESGLEGVVHVQTDPAKLSSADLPIGPAGRLELPDRDDAVVSGTRDQSVTTAFAARLARALFADSRFVRAVEETERQLGIRFEEEFLHQFGCPSVSVFEPGAQRFAARSCIRDPDRMRRLLPRIAPRLPSIVRGLQSLDNEGLVALLLVAPDAPITPSLLGMLGSVFARPLPGGDEGVKEQLYELTGLRDPDNLLAPAGPDRAVFGMIGDDFVVASDREAAREAAQLQTRPYEQQAATAMRAPAELLFAAASDDRAVQLAARLLEEISVSVAGDRSGITARAKLSFSR